jgi:hypothetical protein
MQASTQSKAAHSGPALAAGTIQAHVSDGVLQAKVSLWNVKLTAGIHPSGPAIQRKSAHGVEAFRVPLRQKAGGLPLPSDVRTKMETAFGADFSDVRVHVGREATSLGAIAYTWGTNIHFAPGQYNPHSLQGQKLLGHELWHVLQQKQGRVRNPFGGGVAVVQDHALEAEADRVGIKAAMTVMPRRNDKN